MPARVVQEKQGRPGARATKFAERDIYAAHRQTLVFVRQKPETLICRRVFGCVLMPAFGEALEAFDMRAVMPADVGAREQAEQLAEHAVENELLFRHQPG